MCMNNQYDVNSPVFHIQLVKAAKLKKINVPLLTCVKQPAA